MIPNPPPQPRPTAPATDVMRTVEFLALVAVLRRLLCAQGAQHVAFRAPSRLPGRTRSLRRYADGSCRVAVDVRGRTTDMVVTDLVAGVAAALHWSSEDAADLRRRLASAFDAERARAA